MSKRKVRNSSVELLRIICMILIVAHHYSYYGGFPALSTTYMTGEGIFIQLIGAFGQVSCAVFAIISGYYLCQVEFDSAKKVFNHYKKIIPTIAQFVFYSVVILLVMGLTGKLEFTSENVIKSLFPYVFCNWFVRFYIIFYLFVPFLNMIVSKISYKMFTGLVAMLVIIWSIIPSLAPGSFNYGCLDFFLVMYFIGAYIHKYLEKRISTKIVVIGTIVSLLAYLLVLMAYDLVGYHLQSDEIIKKTAGLVNYTKILPIAFSTFVFMLFSRFKFHNAYINIISGSVMGIYLIHDNDNLRYFIWREVSPNYLYETHPFLHLLIKVLAVFVICLFIDLARSETTGRLFNKYYNKAADIVWNKIKPKKIVGNQENSEIKDICEE